MGVDGENLRERGNMEKYKCGVVGSFNLYLTPFSLGCKSAACVWPSPVVGEDGFWRAREPRLCHTLRPVTSGPAAPGATEENVALCFKQVLLLSTRSKTRQPLQHLSV